MASHENRVILGSIVLAFVAILLVSTVLDTFGFDSSGPIVSFLFFPVFIIVVPQLYLAFTDETIEARTRIRFAALATAAFAVPYAFIAFTSETQTLTLEQAVIVGIGGCSLFGLLGYEFLEGYRSSSDEGVSSEHSATDSQ